MAEHTQPAGEIQGATTDEADERGGFAEAARTAWQDERVEIIAAILLSLATVLSAWGAYQATRWSGVQANSYASSAALRAESVRHGSIASRQIQVDVATFIAWSNAKAAGDTKLTTFYENRFRTEFKPAFDAWLQGALGPSGLPVGTPFDLPEYKLAQQEVSDQNLAEAEANLARAQAANQTSDNFVLTAVLFASVLFFAGMAARFRPKWLRWLMLGVALVVCVIGLAVEFSLPQNIGF
ncbi:MAG: hypothetical protein ACJ778_13050 [Chloroflexota bacterium]